MHSISIPHLELMGAVIGKELAIYIDLRTYFHINFPVCNIHFKFENKLIDPCNVELYNIFQ